jgi:hypothetical protein
MRVKSDVFGAKPEPDTNKGELAISLEVTLYVPAQWSI